MRAEPRRGWADGGADSDNASARESRRELPLLPGHHMQAWTNDPRVPPRLRGQGQRISSPLRAWLSCDGHGPASTGAAATVNIHCWTKHGPGGEVGPVSNHPGHVDPPDDSGEPRKAEDEPREAGVGGRFRAAIPWHGGSASSEPRVRLNHQLTTLLLRNCPPSTHPNTMYLLCMRIPASMSSHFHPCVSSIVCWCSIWIKVCRYLRCHFHACKHSSRNWH